jgi:hypothetical protein
VNLKKIYPFFQENNVHEFKPKKNTGREYSSLVDGRAFKIGVYITRCILPILGRNEITCCIHY